MKTEKQYACDHCGAPLEVEENGYVDCWAYIDCEQICNDCARVALSSERTAAIETARENGTALIYRDENGWSQDCPQWQVAGPDVAWADILEDFNIGNWFLVRPKQMLAEVLSVGPEVGAVTIQEFGENT